MKPSTSLFPKYFAQSMVTCRVPRAVTQLFVDMLSNVNHLPEQGG